MESITITGTAYELPPIPPSTGGGGGFAFALAKGGSILFNDALHHLTHGGPVPYISLPNFFGQHGIDIMTTELPPPSKEALSSYLRNPGILFGGWRDMPTNFTLPLSFATRTFLFVRDPRDILISFYFYLRHSAPITDAFGTQVSGLRGHLEQTSIDDFAIPYATKMCQRFARYARLPELCDLRVIRYEDVIFDKMRLLDAICEHFRLDVSQARRQRIAARIDKRPVAEDVTSHVRQVAPGDHRRKLRPDTIAQIDEVFSEVLRRYGYCPEPTG